MDLLRFDRRALAAFGPGDVLIIVGFVLIGEISHGALPWQVPVIVLETLLTFVVGWVVVAPFVWAYQEPNLSSGRTAVITGLVAWVGASLVANLIRSTSLVHGNASVTFFLVTIGFGGAMFALWRYLRVPSLR